MNISSPYTLKNLKNNDRYYNEISIHITNSVFHRVAT